MKFPAELRVALALGVAILASASSCTRSEGNSHKGSPEGTVLARVGSEYLPLEEVRLQLPGGLSEEDSARFVKGYVYSWVDTRLLSAMADDELDMAEIDRLVEEYRRSLIADAYRRRIAEDGSLTTFAEDSLKAWYNEHKSDFKLRSNLVKGVYVKLPEKTANLSQIRKLIRSDKTEDIDRLEKEVLKSQAIHYDYFREQWVDWDQIEAHIPYDFSNTGHLRPGYFLETSAGGFTYLLRITEVAPKGSPMPYEAAHDEVRERMLADRRRQADAVFRADLLQRAVETGRAEIFILND